MMPETSYNTRDALAVLDFRSLYPSIIIAHNLSYDTLLMSDDRDKLNDDDFEKGLGPIESFFVKNHVCLRMTSPVMTLWLCSSLIGNAG